MSGFMNDVLDQPVSMRTAVSGYFSEKNLDQLEALQCLQFDKILFTGMGSSHFCSIGAGIYLIEHGITAIVRSASQVLHYEFGLIKESTLLVLVSQSGESAEVVGLIEKLQDKVHVVGITNNPESTLGKRADTLLTMNVAEEEAVSTRTYLSSVILTGMVAKAITGGDAEPFLPSVQHAISQLEESLHDFQANLTRLKGFLTGTPYLCLMGRGYSLPSAHCGALFIREAAKYPSIDFDSGEFRHGPFEMVEKGFTAMIFAADGPVWPLHAKLAVDVLAKDGKVIFVTNRRPDTLHDNLLVLEIPSVDPLLLPLVETVPAQMVAIALAENKGIEAGKFRWSAKITSKE